MAIFDDKGLHESFYRMADAACLPDVMPEDLRRTLSGDHVPLIDGGATAGIGFAVVPAQKVPGTDIPVYAVRRVDEALRTELIRTGLLRAEDKIHILYSEARTEAAARNQDVRRAVPFNILFV